MKIFILEYFTSRTKDPEEKISFYNEGIKMLKTVINSAAAASSAEITALIHRDFYQELLSRLKEKNPRSSYDNINFIYRNSNSDTKKDYLKYLKRLQLKDFDYFLIIAPESDNISSDITEILEKKEISNLGSSSKTIKKTADKWLFYKKFSNDFNIPKTKVINSKDLSFLENNILPAVVKAKYSAGSELKIVENKNDFFNYYNKVLKYQIKKRDYIIQKIIPGEAGSISVLSTAGEYKILSINKQIIEKKDFSYQGGIINYPFRNTSIIKNAVVKIKKVYPGLNGYFGIDFIYNNGSYYFLEINPRLTSSIIGLAELYNFFKLIISSENNNKSFELDIPDNITNKQLKFMLD